MEILTTFVVVNDALVAVRYDNEENHEFARLFDLWSDPVYLHDFFVSQKEDLQSGFFGGISVDEAVMRTLDEAIQFQEMLLGLAESGKTKDGYNLTDLFKPLSDNDIITTGLEKDKAYGPNTKSWLRLYAIRVGPNQFVISGGAIKLTRSMNERPHTQKELDKLEMTKKYLVAKGIDTDNFFELTR